MSTTVVFVSTALLFGAVGADARPTTLGPNVVAVVAFDHGFQAPDRVAAGLTTVKLVSESVDLHHAYIIRLDRGNVLSDLTATMRTPNAKLPASAVGLGGPNTPGVESSVTLTLKAGRYAVICVTPTNDGQPHFVHGMIRAIWVD